MKSSIDIESAHSASAGEFRFPSEALRADRPNESHVVYLWYMHINYRSAFTKSGKQNGKGYL